MQSLAQKPCVRLDRTCGPQHRELRHASQGTSHLMSFLCVLLHCARLWYKTAFPLPCNAQLVLGPQYRELRHAQQGSFYLMSFSCIPLHCARLWLVKQHFHYLLIQAQYQVLSIETELRHAEQGSSHLMSFLCIPLHCARLWLVKLHFHYLVTQDQYQVLSIQRESYDMLSKAVPISCPFYAFPYTARGYGQ